MKFDGFYGNLRIKEYLSNSIDGGQVSHAYMFYGPDGIGKKTVADITAAALVCQGKDDKPCGVCPGCIKSCRGSHPDIIHIRRSKASIGVDEIRGLKQDAYILPNDGEKKVYIIHEADTMTHEAQDALLKILEEPPAFTVFLLLCYNEKSMLETVRSRCVRLAMSPLNREEMREFLAAKLPGYADDEFAKLWAKSGGIPGKAVEDDTDEEGIARALRIAKAVSGKNELAIVESFIAVEKIKRDEILVVFECLLSYIRDALVCSGDNGGLHSDEENSVSAELSSGLPRQTLVELSEVLIQAKKYCSQNIGVAHITGYLACEFCRAVRK